MAVKQSLLDRLRLIIAGHVGRPRIAISDEALLEEELGLDWFDIEELTLFAAYTIGKENLATPPLTTRTVGDLLSYLTRATKQKE